MNIFKVVGGTQSIQYNTIEQLQYVAQGVKQGYPSVSQEKVLPEWFEFVSCHQ